jgi:hypothetical protein
VWVSRGYGVEIFGWSSWSSFECTYMREGNTAWASGVFILDYGVERQDRRQNAWCSRCQAVGLWLRLKWSRELARHLRVEAPLGLWGSRLLEAPTSSIDFSTGSHRSLLCFSSSYEDTATEGESGIHEVIEKLSNTISQDVWPLRHGLGTSQCPQNNTSHYIISSSHSYPHSTPLA